jgi:hypothetical protein
MLCTVAEGDYSMVFFNGDNAYISLLSNRSIMIYFLASLSLSVFSNLLPCSVESSLVVCDIWCNHRKYVTKKRRGLRAFFYCTIFLTKSHRTCWISLMKNRGLQITTRMLKKATACWRWKPAFIVLESNICIITQFMR